MKVLVSGGNGLVGRHVVEGLAAAGHTVTIGGRHRPERALRKAGIGFQDLLLDPDRDQVDAFTNVDAFVHLAFDHLAGRYRGGEGDDPKGFWRRNLQGSARLFDEARRAGIGRVIFLSSRAVYDGLPAGIRLTEDMALSPTSLYGKVKLEAERALQALSGEGFVTASLRSTGVYDDRSPNKWDELAADFLAGRGIAPRAGTEVHGCDVANAVLILLEAKAKKIDGRSFNLSDLLIDRADILAPLQAKCDRHVLPARAGEGTVSEMDCERLLSLGWKPGGRALFEKTVKRLSKRWAQSQKAK